MNSYSAASGAAGADSGTAHTLVFALVGESSKPLRRVEYATYSSASFSSSNSRRTLISCCERGMGKGWVGIDSHSLDGGPDAAGAGASCCVHSIVYIVLCCVVLSVVGTN